MWTAEDKLWELRQVGRKLERYVEDFLKIVHQLSWPDAALGACFLLGLDSDTIRCELTVSDFPLIALIDLILYLNGYNFEIEGRISILLPRPVWGTPRLASSSHAEDPHIPRPRSEPPA